MSRLTGAERRIALAPAEGWTTFVAVALMLLTAAVAVNDANWAGFVAGTSERQTAFLPLAAMLAAIVGLALAKSGLPTIRGHFIGAAVGAAYLLYAVSGAISTSSSVPQRLRDLADSLGLFVHEVVVLGLTSAETSAFLLILGAIVWAAGQFAVFSVFRRRRALPAIAVATSILLVNMAITVENQYVHLVMLTAAALWLLVRLNLLQQIEVWRARRIEMTPTWSNSSNDGGYVSELFLRSGAVFVVIAIVGSLTLAANASSAPLQRAWDDMDDQLLGLGYEVNRWVGGVTGAARGPSNLFGPSQVIRDYWESSTEPVFTATTSDGRGHYWRGATYDTFNGVKWDQTAVNPQSQVIPAGESVLAETAESVDPAAGDRREVVATITSVAPDGDYLVAPEAPYAFLDRSTELLTRESGNFLASKATDGLESGQAYSVASLVRKGRGERGALTASHLASAGTDYPEWVTSYTDIREGTIGRSVYREADRIVSRLPGGKRDPYHVSAAIQNYLFSDGGFQYVTDVRGLCAGEQKVDCFLRVKRGYCEYFATAMAMMLRTQGIPARYTVGYLPGKPVDEVDENEDPTDERIVEDGLRSWHVDRSAAHAWVEVYFPTYGWIRFDPTPGNTGNGQTPTRFDAGPPASAGEEPQPTPRSEAPESQDAGNEELTREFAAQDTPPAGGGFPDLAGLAVLAVLFLAVLALLVGLSLRRLPNTQPELAYRSVARIASRFGHGPRPTQTAYEFADGLGALVPAVRSDLRVVATAKVEHTYGRREPQGDALRQLRQAYGRARLGLLRLLVRRPSAPRRPRGT